ncbi:MAG: phosphate signaling complex protein PhoU [Spirochaetes bacterium]|jgi:phosphate transport system protein|nr:phosphate signaling complex protein PhoU [Spirochaetota bacterium]
MAPRKYFLSQLDKMYQDVLRMGALVEEALKKSVTALASHDYDLAERIIEEDRSIDKLQVEIEDHCTELLATQQPVASDLREILTTIRIVDDLERIGDHARHLARAVGDISDETFVTVLPSIEEMAERGISMMHDALTAFVDQDAEQAVAVAERDAAIDRMQKTLYGKLIDIVRDHPDKADKAMNLMFMVRFLERLGDHVRSVCEWVVYAKRGEHVELRTPRK